MTIYDDLAHENGLPPEVGRTIGTARHRLSSNWAFLYIETAGVFKINLQGGAFT
jgi:hypothetical protein